MAKTRSKLKAIGPSNGANHKYVAADDDDGDSDALAAEAPSATANAATATAATAIAATATAATATAATATATAATATAATAATATAISYSDDEGNVIIESHSASVAAPVSPIPELAEMNDGGDCAPPSACIPEPVTAPTPILVAPIPPIPPIPTTDTFDVTVDVATSTSDVTSAPLKPTSVCGAICNCFRALFKALCCGCCCCRRRRRTTNHATTGPTTGPTTAIPQ